jgi:hypothetical protein
MGVAYTMHGGDKKLCKILIGKCERNIPLGRNGFIWLRIGPMAAFVNVVLNLTVLYKCG